MIQYVFIIQRFLTIERGAEHFIKELLASFPESLQKKCLVLTLVENEYLKKYLKNKNNVNKSQSLINSKAHMQSDSYVEKKSYYTARYKTVCLPLPEALSREKTSFLFHNRILRKILTSINISSAGHLESFWLYCLVRYSLLRYIFVGKKWTKLFEDYGISNNIDHDSYEFSGITRFYSFTKKSDQVMLFFPIGGYWTFHIANFLANPEAKIVAVSQSGFIQNELELCHYYVSLTRKIFKESYKYNNNVKRNKKLFLIPNGVNTDKFKYDTENEKTIASKKIGKITHIISVSALTEDKCVYLILDAFLHLTETYFLSIFGDGPLKNELMKHPAFSSGRAVIECISYKDIAQKYKEADIFTLASPNEAFGIVFLEAMASGLPCVANNNENQRFVLADAGYFCNVFDSMEYAATIRRAAEESKKQDRKRQLTRAERFSYKRIGKRYIKKLKLE